MRRSVWPCGIIVSCALSGCRVAHVDTLTAAGRHAEDGRFLEALGILDKLPPSHEQYTQARTLAQAFERRIRASQEKVLQGLALRTQWRDEEAVRSFQEALDIWSHVVAARGLKTATENRIAAFAADRDVRTNNVDENAPVGEVITTPIGEVTTTPVGSGEEVRSAPGFEGEPEADVVRGEAYDPRAKAGMGTRNADPTVLTGPVEKVGSRSASTQPLRLKIMRRRKLLGQARWLLIRGDMDRALDILEDLWDEAPGDRNIAQQLAGVLHQRAMLEYGQGRLEAAIADWQKVVRLEKDNAQVEAFIRAAKTELAARKRRPPKS